MMNVGGVWLPDGERHMSEWMQTIGRYVDGKLTYQNNKYKAALKECRSFRRAIDVGAHCGTWAMQMEAKFSRVDAFEPLPEHLECLSLNARSVNIHPYAVGEEAGECFIRTVPGSSGAAHIADDGVSATVVSLDEYLGPVDDLDFMKLDCEGYELPALMGAEKMLRRCRPVVVVEQKPKSPAKYGFPDTGAVTWLESLGAVLVKEMAGDYLMVWPDEN